MDGNTVLIIVLVIAVGFLVLLALQYIRAKRIGRGDRIIAFTGEPGAGKTFNVVEQGEKRYKSLKTKHKLGLLKGDEPTVWTTFPCKIDGEMTKVLKREHLFFKELLPDNCVILISEFSEMASNLDYDNPNVVLYLDLWIRFCRHFYNAYVIIDDQAFGQVLINIRRRTSTVYSLSNFRRWLYITPFYKVNVDELKCIEDTINVNNVAEDNEQYLIGFLPYKFMQKNKYNTRCYMNVKETGLTFNAPDEWSDDMYTNYIIDLSATKEEVKNYKEEGRKYSLYRMFKETKKGIEDCLELAYLNGDVQKIKRYEDMLDKMEKDKELKKECTVEQTA